MGNTAGFTHAARFLCTPPMIKDKCMDTICATIAKLESSLKLACYRWFNSRSGQQYLHCMRTRWCQKRSRVSTRDTFQTPFHLSKHSVPSTRSMHTNSIKTCYQDILVHVQDLPPRKKLPQHIANSNCGGMHNSCSGEHPTTMIKLLN